MENTTPPTILNHGDFEISPETKEKIKNTVLNLPKDESWLTPYHLYQGFWTIPHFLEGDILAHHFFKAEPTDIFICSVPKSGTTWLKALTFAIVSRTHFNTNSSPLLQKVPHDCVPFLPDFATNFDIREPGLPLISTHVPYTCLPKSALELDSNCKIVYICREPKDAFISLYHFIAKRRDKELSLDKALDQFCQGNSLYGPYWDHVLGFWKASQDKPGKVFFLKYEEMMKDTAFYVKKLAEFMDCPFSPEEEKQGRVQEIMELCSFESLKTLEVNKSGIWQPSLARVENNTFFRKGKIGDWKNWLTPDMAERLDKIMDEKLSGSGLTFHI
ncbi:hypothetical protein COLO4_29468 [Corchorus olitorius]|uniref:Sulfotransferase n=1 Tax=Corchorus olitorius TaxID=93759 RepID=A0A1R3HEI6_9ROSI|nr:hypothetical protein COLO4_29468 [Corchorus olitorius]